MIDTPKFLGQLVSPFATNSWPLGVQAGLATGDPLAFVGFHDVLAIYWYYIQYWRGRANARGRTLAAWLALDRCDAQVR